MAGILIIVALLVVMWLVLIRPQRRRTLQQQQLLGSLEVGAEIVSAGGLYGRIVAIEGDDLMVELAPGVEVRMARRAVGAVVGPEPEDEEDEEDEEYEEDEELEEEEPAELEAQGASGSADGPEPRSADGQRS